MIVVIIIMIINIMSGKSYGMSPPTPFDWHTAMHYDERIRLSKIGAIQRQKLLSSPQLGVFQNVFLPAATFQTTYTCITINAHCSQYDQNSANSLTLHAIHSKSLVLFVLFALFFLAQALGGGRPPGYAGRPRRRLAR